jgi:hypothetical protein
MSESRVDNVEQFASENEDENVVVRVLAECNMQINGTMRDFLPGSYKVNRAFARAMLRIDRERVEVVSGDVLDPNWSDRKRVLVARRLGI